ncbi:MAG: hypothetical protein KDA91_22835, partial [Planctomycetaceae bacterium]|nr:hypothetical protein [Planctomycetaceae bacterium]
AGAGTFGRIDLIVISQIIRKVYPDAAIHPMNCVGCIVAEHDQIPVSAEAETGSGRKTATIGIRKGAGFLCVSEQFSPLRIQTYS